MKPSIKKTITAGLMQILTIFFLKSLNVPNFDIFLFGFVAYCFTYFFLLKE